MALRIWRRSDNTEPQIRRPTAEDVTLLGTIWFSTKTRCEADDTESLTSDRAPIITTEAAVRGEEAMRKIADPREETTGEDGIGAGTGSQRTTTVIGAVTIRSTLRLGKLEELG